MLGKNNRIILYLMISIIVSFVWFKDRMIVAGAEEGIPFYSPIRALTTSKGLWHELDLGFSTPFYIPRLPFLVAVNFLHRSGLASWFVQALVFGQLILVALIFFDKLVQNFFPDDQVTPLVASLFYLFNLYTLSQVWARMLYSQFFLWSLVPIFIYSWIKWMNTARIKYLLLLLIACFIYSYAFSMVSAVFVIWLLAGIYFLVFHFNKIGFLLSIIGFSSWLLLNSWWILPFATTGGGTLSALNNPTQNLTALVDVSKYFPGSEILLLKQKFYFGDNGFWKDYYSEGFTNLMGIVTLLFVIIGITASSKNRNWIFWFITLVATWFVVKGSNPPLGQELYSILFKRLPIFQAIRNPYEKMGLVYLVAYSVFFGYGMKSVLTKFKLTRYPIIIPLVLFFFFIYVKPLWTGAVFNGYKISVPKYYEQVNVAIVDEGKDYRVLHMPYQVTGLSKYTWGFTGADANKSLLDNSSIGEQTLQGTQDFYRSLSKYVNRPNFSNVLKITSGCCVLLHKDVIADNNYLQDWQASKLQIQNWKGVSLKETMGNVELYTLDKTSRLDRVYISTKLEASLSTDDILDKITSSGFDPYQVTYLVTNPGETVLPTNLTRPHYETQKITSTHYRVKIEEAHQPFVIVLNNAHNLTWNAWINNEKQPDHLEVNGYANGWIIRREGDYIIDITFNNL